MVFHPQYILLCHRETAHNVNYTDYAMTVYTYYPASETADIADLVRTITAPEGNIIEYTYGTTGSSKGFPVTKVLKDGNTIVSKIEYEYNSQLQISNDKTSVNISKRFMLLKNTSMISSTM